MLPGEIEFRAWSPGTLGTREVLDNLHLMLTAARVRAALGTAIVEEGPIQADRLVRAVGNAFGFERVRAERRSAMLALLPRRVIHDREEGFVWPVGIEARSWQQFRSSRHAPDRTLDEISLREIANAMEAVGAGDGGMAVDDVYRETLAIFGLRRMTSGVRSRLDMATAHARSPADPRQAAIRYMTSSSD